MRKLILFILTVIVAFFVYVNVNADIGEIVIPKAAIRVRVIANSNTVDDQSMKMKVKALIEKNISPLLVEIDNVEDARTIIRENINKLENDIEVFFDNENYNKDFIVNFGDNYFPEKNYKGVHYDEGSYESLVVTIGQGSGDNWWCVLFPPLCLLEADESDVDDNEYQFFVKEMLDKIFS